VSDCWRGGGRGRKRGGGSGGEGQPRISLECAVSPRGWEGHSFRNVKQLVDDTLPAHALLAQGRGRINRRWWERNLSSYFYIRIFVSVIGLRCLPQTPGKCVDMSRRHSSTMNMPVQTSSSDQQASSDPLGSGKKVEAPPPLAWGAGGGGLHLVTIRACVGQCDRVSFLSSLPKRLVPPLDAAVQVVAPVVCGQLQRVLSHVI